MKKSAWYYTILIEHFHVNHNLKANKMLTVLQMNRHLPWAQHPPPPPITSIHLHTSLTMINGTQFKKNPHFVEKKNLVSTCILIPLFPSCANLLYLALLNAWILSINLFYSFPLKIGRKNNFIMKKKTTLHLRVREP